MIKVKICGITNLEDALCCSQEGADALGFIFSKRSPRYINEKEAKKIISHLDPYISKVGIFVDEKKEKVIEVANFLQLGVLQFHGEESVSYCNFFKERFKVIKTFFPSSKPFKEQIAPYKVDAYLFDIRYEEKLKGKKSLPKEVLKETASLIKENCRVIISGGLNVENILQVKKINPYAVDVASGLEKMVGKKDIDLVRLFVRRTKEDVTAR
jgi:phosphoribosylanthranilate isomerase